MARNKTEPMIATSTRHFIQTHPKIAETATKARAYLKRNGICDTDDQAVVALFVIVRGALPSPCEWEKVEPRQIR